MLKSWSKTLSCRLMDEFLTDTITSALHVPIPANENHRLQVVQETSLLDSNPTDEAYDRFCNMAARLFRSEIALISLVDVDRVWYKSKIGVELDGVPRNVSFCSHTIANVPKYSVVADLSKSEYFKDHMLVKHPYNFRFYAGVNIIIDSEVVGTVCVMDRKERRQSLLNGDQIQNLIDLTNIVQDMMISSRNKYLAAEIDAAQISVLVYTGLKYPLEAACSIFQNMKGLLEVLSSTHIKTYEEEVYDLELKKKSNLFAETITLLGSVIETSLQNLLSHNDLNLMESSPHFQPQYCHLSENIAKLLLLLKDITRLEFLACSLDIHNETIATYPDLLQLVIYIAVLHFSQRFDNIQIVGRIMRKDDLQLKKTKL
mmetsp:Transcript_655/g.1128  ORF Transcript_655/g.1128 Transcript_655/m.1128 type:complete len:372 (+) Transcript_655:40-1155(+)